MPQITMTAERLKNAAHREKDYPRAVHWLITLKSENGRIMQTEYSEGIGHFITLPYGQRHTLDVEEVYEEIKSGKPFAVIGKLSYLYEHLTPRVPVKNRMAKVAPPQLVDVLRCLAMDATALEQKFEEWAAELGHDTDSRKAYTIWEQCCNIARDMRALGFTDEDLQKLREEE